MGPNLKKTGAPHSRPKSLTTYPSRYIPSASHVTATFDHPTSTHEHPPWFFTPVTNLSCVENTLESDRNTTKPKNKGKPGHRIKTPRNPTPETKSHKPFISPMIPTAVLQDQGKTNNTRHADDSSCTMKRDPCAALITLPLQVSHTYRQRPA